MILKIILNVVEKNLSNSFSKQNVRTLSARQPPSSSSLKGNISTRLLLLPLQKPTHRRKNQYHHLFRHHLDDWSYLSPSPPSTDAYWCSRGTILLSKPLSRHDHQYHHLFHQLFTWSSCLSMSQSAASTGAYWRSRDKDSLILPIRTNPDHHHQSPLSSVTIIIIIITVMIVSRIIIISWYYVLGPQVWGRCQRAYREPLIDQLRCKLSRFFLFSSSSTTSGAESWLANYFINSVFACPLFSVDDVVFLETWMAFKSSAV